MPTFLQLTQQLVAELGIGGANQGGTVPTTVVGQTGQLYNAVNWIAQAENNLNLLHEDWRFLKAAYSENLVVGDREPVMVSGGVSVARPDRGSWWLDRNTTEAAQLTWQDWEDFRNLTEPGAHATNTRPTIITFRPRDEQFVLDEPPDDTYTLTGEFWRYGSLMTGDSDLPAMPVQFHRLIVCEAAIKYGNKEAAPEIINGMEAEYAFLLDKLESDQLEGAEYNNMYAADKPIQMDIPGYDEVTDRGTKWWL